MPSRSSTNASGTSTSSANAESRPALMTASGANRRDELADDRPRGDAAVSGRSAKPSRGGVPITATLRTSRGSCSTSALATVPPIEWPTTTARLTRSLRSASATRRAWFVRRIAVARHLRAAVAEQVEPDHVQAAARELGRHAVPPPLRAREAVQQDDRRVVALARLLVVEVAALELHDLAASARLGVLGLAVGHHRVHDQQQRRPRRAPMSFRISRRPPGTPRARARSRRRRRRGA